MFAWSWVPGLSDAHQTLATGGWNGITFHSKFGFTFSPMMEWLVWITGDFAQGVMDYRVASTAGCVVGVFNVGHFRRLSEITASVMVMGVACACPVSFLVWPADPGGLLVLWSMQHMTICMV